MQAILGYTSEAKWLRHARAHLCHLFPYLPQQPGYTRQLRKAAGLMRSVNRILATTTSVWSDDVWGVDSTPVECGPPDYDESSARRDHQASAAVIALSASWMPSPTSPAVAAQCKGIRATAPGSHRCSSRVSGSGAVPS